MTIPDTRPPARRAQDRAASLRRAEQVRTGRDERDCCVTCGRVWPLGEKRAQPPHNRRGGAVGPGKRRNAAGGHRRRTSEDAAGLVLGLEE